MSREVGVKCIMKTSMLTQRVNMQTTVVCTWPTLSSHLGSSLNQDLDLHGLAKCNHLEVDPFRSWEFLGCPGRRRCGRRCVLQFLSNAIKIPTLVCCKCVHYNLFLPEFPRMTMTIFSLRVHWALYNFGERPIKVGQFFVPRQPISTHQGNHDKDMN